MTPMKPPRCVRENASQSHRVRARLSCAETEDGGLRCQQRKRSKELPTERAESAGHAIKAAQQSAPGADRLVEWTLKEISGRQGGIAGFRDVTVVIRARVS